MGPLTGALFLGGRMLFLIENEQIRIVLDDKGAELLSFFHKLREQEIIWNGAPEYWPRHAPVLFPIVGRLKNDRYTMDGKVFNLSQHGFARDSVFEAVEKRKDSVTFKMTDTEECLKKYPFSFSLGITYTLAKQSLNLDFEITNTGKERMPFSIGGHPGFACPFFAAETLEDYAFYFEEDENCKRLFIEDGLIAGEDKFILNNKVLPLSEQLFLKDALILRDLRSKKVHLGRLDGGGPKIEVDFSGFPFLGLWKRKGAPFVCIEPWLGLPDHKEKAAGLFDKEGIIILPPKEKFKAEFAISIS
jgi:galactose mutarotase-like enzyme